MDGCCCKSSTESGQTMPCFAGETMFVTSLREGRDDEALRRWPALGGMFAAPVTGMGVSVGLFTDA